MADLIPSLSSCKPRMTRGERRLAERLEASLEAGCLLWYDVPVGRKARHPDFIVFHPRRGVLVLEVKDWRTEDLRAIDRAQVASMSFNDAFGNRQTESDTAACSSIRLPTFQWN